jgi:SHS2 domain-containing protein
MPKYEFVEHSADVAFKVYGRDLNELFANAAEALESTLIRLETVAQSETKAIKISSDNYEDLLYDWLAELLLNFDVEYFAFKKCVVSIADFSLAAQCMGERVDLSKHKLNREVKAVTYHKLQVVKNDVYHAEITLDV